MLPAISTDAKPSFVVSDQICKCFSLDQILSATQNFDEALVVGQGGFGKVYKGMINDDGSNTIVAIKRSNSMSNQGALQFRAEVEMLSRIRHCNLVSLLGYCNEGTEMALVYEYMPQGTLEDHLHKAGTPLSWLQRLKICIGAARGLEYLHTGIGTQHGIIHRDVKSSNVLLDENFAAKISDFGLAKIGELTRKSDVYSFGVLLLEVICGRPAVDTSLDEEQWGLAPWAQERIKEGKRNHIVDSRLRGQISSSCLKGFVRIASRCLHNQPNQRPRMAEIVAKLEIVLSLQERDDSSIAEGKFIGKFWSFFQAKVDSTAGEGESSHKEGDGLNNTMVTKGKANVSGREGNPRDKTGKATSAMVPPSSSSQTEGNLKSFSYNVLREATTNFRHDKFLGESDYGSVFKGWIDESSLAAAKPGTGTVIAVRRIHEPLCEGDHHEWLAQNNYIGLLNHPNLVKLIGYCVRGYERFQVCEFMPQGSLENHLFRKAVTSIPLPWNLRIKIILGAAKGLAYLHDRETDKICCNIKPKNILVDSDYNGKLSNFWLKEDVETRCDTFETWELVNSSYAAPEYVVTGRSTARSDIYSLGVVLLEVLTGKRNIDNNRPANQKLLVDWARPYLHNKQGIRRIIDHSIEGQVSPTLAMKFAVIMNRCLSSDPRDRPTADEVVKALEELQALQIAAPARTRKAVRKPVASASASTSGSVQKSCSYQVRFLAISYSIDKDREVSDTRKRYAATQNFDEALVVGQGGFGKVYKGMIKNGSNTLVAIKRSNSMSNQGALQFRAEVEMLSGFDTGTLDDHLHKDGTPLSWLQRLKICIGAARGLEYLHTGTGTQHGIIHRDVKSSNVLLDENFAAKISDFGLAKIGPTNQTRTHVSTLVKGTFGYLDPHYVYTGELTRKSDVYSFGVLLLEVICGRPAVDTSLDEEQWGLAPWAQERIKEGKRNHIVDSRLRGQISSSCLKGFVRIASQCLHNQPNQRPRMAEIIARLEIVLSLQEREDSSIAEGKFVGKFLSFFQAKVDSTAGEGESSQKEGDGLNNTMVTKGKANVSGREGNPRDKTGKATSAMVPPSSSSRTEGNLKSFSYNVLKEATMNFRPNMIPGESGSVSVFKGWIDESSLAAAKPGTGTVIAVRRIHGPRWQQANHNEWLDKNYYIGLLNHPNLVKLIGYCVEEYERFHVCEFMTRGSLENLLFRKGANFEALSWNLRIKIIFGAAKGLAYLHDQETDRIYCSINPKNILVDSDYNGKLSNFRLIENVHARETLIGCSTARIDIYDFGVVLLEVLTGKPNIDNNRPHGQQIQVDYLRPYLDNKQGVQRIIDPCIEGQLKPTLTMKFAMIVNRCISIDSRHRPTADEVVKALEELQALQKAAPTRTKEVVRKPTASASASSSANVQKS
ncbi:hypothetical protein OSB04_016247 [Centaurea solstitialis]|uniref:Protein kinase domain-containing protein n=1 Tax=Centaurea solstitialis TaxID=347529 RepID=A0AA38W8A3_9ASTR|nr:hypothetical protein OSB04_016247 [Centaurea solstitialis]